MQIYCVKCKKKTATKDEKAVGGARPRIQGKCTVCGTAKSQFVKSPQTGGEKILRGYRRPKSVLINPIRPRPRVAFADGGPLLPPQMGGESLINRALNSGILPELHLYGRNETTGKYQKHNFTGPGTDFEGRTENGKPKSWSRPINRVDEAAFEHDKCYNSIKDLKGRHACDRAMVHKLDTTILADPKAHWANKLEARIVRGVISGKEKLGLGRQRR